MLYFYYHGGSANHGCEALVRSTRKVLGREAVLLTSAPEEDLHYGLDQVVTVRPDRPEPVPRRSLTYLAAALEHRLRGSDYRSVRAARRGMLSQIHRGDVCLSIGGDNYCYGAEGNRILGYYNRMLNEKGASTVLWGCSIEPEAMTPPVVEDLKRYALITARESITYGALLDKGLTNAVQVPDAAFLLDWEEAPLPSPLRAGETVGVNVSPLVQDLGDLVLENYRGLVRAILEETDQGVLLLPHVVKPESDDRGPLRQLLSEFASTGRVALAEDASCTVLKGLIAQCSFFVGARTHATIAAYSTGVPTLVAGYSVKARGIARDLFGTEEGYVLPVQSFTGPRDLARAFLALYGQREEVKERLAAAVPGYQARVRAGAEAVEALLTNG